MASVVFTEEVYTVTEGEDGYAEVCVALDGGVSFNSSSANATFNIATFSITGLLVTLLAHFQQRVDSIMKGVD